MFWNVKVELFQASAVQWLRTAISFIVTQRVVVIPYRRFGRTYRSHLQRPRIRKESRLH